MKIKITHPILTDDGNYQAGEIVDVTDAEALEYIEQEWAFRYSESDKTLELKPKRKRKEVENDDWQNS